MLEKLVLPEIRELIAAKDEETLRQTLDRWLPPDVVELFADLSDEEDVAGLHMLRGPQRARVFEYLDRASQRNLLANLSEDDTRSLLNEIADDDRTALLAEFEETDRQRLLRLLSEEQRTIAESLLQYPEGSVGRLMTPHFVAVRSHWTVQHVLDHIRQHGQDSETLNVVYIVDHEHKLIDDLRIRQILLARPQQHLEELLDNSFVALKTTDPKRSAVEVFRQYDRTALPVVDDAGKLIGVVTIDDVLDVAEEAATAEIQKLGGLEALEEPYAATPFSRWFASEQYGGGPVPRRDADGDGDGGFRSRDAKAVVLALFVPLIISSGGNSGSQAATLIVRALAVGEVRLGDWWFVMRRELRPAQCWVRSWEPSASSESRCGACSRTSTVRIGCSWTDGWSVARGDRVVGHALRFDIAIATETDRFGPCNFFGSVRRDARGRDWTGDLFHGGHDHFAGDDPVVRVLLQR